MNPPDEFYVGWEAHAPPGLGRVLRQAVLLLLALAVLAAAGMAVAQRMIGVSAFEWGRPKSFAGVLQTRPYPHLLVERPGAAAGTPRYSTYYLVAPWKFGLNPAVVAPLDGQFVKLKGALIYRGNQTMIEVRPESMHVVGQSVRSLPEPVSLGRQTLTGEIVDSKCFLGVMNPGQLTPHRACAIRCISGGVPPVLLIRQKHGPPTYLLLVSAAGKPVNQQVLDLVAEPVEITGEIERQGDLLILRADPATYRRVK